MIKQVTGGKFSKVSIKQSQDLFMTPFKFEMRACVGEKENKSYWNLIKLTLPVLLLHNLNTSTSTCRCVVL